MAETFTLEIAAFIEKAKSNIDQVIQKTAIDMLSQIIDRSPVGNPELWASNQKGPEGYVGGRFRANWQVTFNAPAANEINAIDPSGGATLQAGTALLMAFNSSARSIFIMNNVPYAHSIEYGHSGKQAPAGVVRITVAEFQTYIDAAVRATQ